jgi:hypothetical protein
MKKRYIDTPEGQVSYERVKREAQRLSDLDGWDRGIECNELFREHRCFMLPNKANRCGHELRCEVVSCSSDERTQKGHGHK